MIGAQNVVITGVGAVSCLGRGAEEFWTGMNSAAPLPTEVLDPHAHMTHTKLYAVSDADRQVDCERLADVPVGAAAGLAITAAREATADAATAGVDPGRVAVVVGSGFGEWQLHERWHVDGYPTDCAWAPTFTTASVLGADLPAHAANISVSNACAAGGYALTMAADLIHEGQAVLVVAGGVETYHRTSMGCFNRLVAADPERCRPFDADRRGTVFGEGAAMVVVESPEHAADRGATVRARLAGSGWSSDGHHLTAPEPDGTRIADAMADALRDAGVGPDDVGCVIPHATGTILNDAVEARALDRVFDGRTRPLHSLKARTGHTGGAAGAFAVVAAVLMLDHRTVPPNAPLRTPDPQCHVRLPTEPVELSRPVVLVNAYGFGGNNVSLVVTGGDGTGAARAD